MILASLFELKAGTLTAMGLIISAWLNHDGRVAVGRSSHLFSGQMNLTAAWLRVRISLYGFLTSDQTLRLLRSLKTEVTQSVVKRRKNHLPIDNSSDDQIYFDVSLLTPGLQVFCHPVQSLAQS